MTAISGGSRRRFAGRTTSSHSTRASSFEPILLVGSLEAEMARYQTASLTTSSVAPGSWLSINQPVASSTINLVKIKVVPNEAGGTSRFQVYKRDTFLEADKLYDTREFTGVLLDPVEDYSDPMTDTPGATAERNEGSPIPYEDDDATNEIHLRVYNGDVDAKTYTIAVKYEQVLVPGGTGGDLTLGNLHLTGWLEVDGTSTLGGAVTCNTTLAVTGSTTLTGALTATSGDFTTSLQVLSNTPWLALENNRYLPWDANSNLCTIGFEGPTNPGVDNTAALWFQVGTAPVTVTPGDLCFRIANGAGTNYLAIRYTSGNIGMGGIIEPIALLANTASNILGTEGFGIAPRSIAWQANGAGWAMALENLNTATNSCGLLIKTATTAGYLLKCDSLGVARLQLLSDGQLSIGNNFAILPDGRLGIGAGTPGTAAVHWKLDYHYTGTFALERSINPAGALFYAADVYGNHGQPLALWTTYNQAVTPLFQMQYINSLRWAFYAGPSFSYLDAPSVDYGANLSGARISVGRNANASQPGPGSVNLISLNGTNGFIWMDSAGNLRIGAGAPTWSSDLSGIVVGNQTSNPKAKEKVKPLPADERTAVIERLFHAPLFTYELKNEIDGGLGGHNHLGFMSDQIPQWMMYDRNTIDSHRVSMEILVGLQELADFVGYAPGGPPRKEDHGRGKT